MSFNGVFDVPRDGMSAEGMAVLYYDPNAERTGPSMSLSYSMATHPVAWLLGTFAAGWTGGYLAWVAIGKYQERKRMSSLPSPMNRKVPFKARKLNPNWYNFPGEK